MDDKMIINLFWNRDERALSAVQEIYGRYCHTIAYNILGVEQDVEECLDDAWLAAWNTIPPKRPDHLSAYLGSITRNLAISRYRAKHAEKRFPDRISEPLDELIECVAGSSDDVMEALDYNILVEAINRYLDTVTQKQRILFVRRYYYMDSISDIAIMFDLGKSDVKVTLHRTRKGLKEFLEKEGLM